jgi:hypothetical protein
LRRYCAVTPKASQNLIRTLLPPAWKYFDPPLSVLDAYRRHLDMRAALLNGEVRTGFGHVGKREA